MSVFFEYNTLISGKQPVIKPSIIVYLGMLANWQNSRRSPIWLAVIDMRRAHVTKRNPDWMNIFLTVVAKAAEQRSGVELPKKLYDLAITVTSLQQICHVFVKSKVSYTCRYLPQRRNGVQIGYSFVKSHSTRVVKVSTLLPDKYKNVFFFFFKFTLLTVLSNDANSFTVNVLWVMTENVRIATAPQVIFIQ